MGWKIGGNLYSPVAEMTYSYEVEGEKYVAMEKISVVHFDPEKVATQFSIYDLGGNVDIHVRQPEPPTAIHYFLDFVFSRGHTGRCVSRTFLVSDLPLI